METIPLLGWIAVAAALVDHLGSRLLLRLATGAGVNQSQLLNFARAGSLARNIAALAALTALAAALIDFVRPRPFMALRKRIGLAVFAGVFMPTLFLVVVLPEERTTAQVVLFATASANVLAALLGGMVLQWRAPRPLRMGVGAAVATAFLAFGAIVFLLINRTTLWQPAYPVGMLMRRSGEFAFIVALLSLGIAGWPRGRPRKVQLAVAMGACIVALVVFAVLLRVRGSVEAEIFGNALYGALHMEMLLESVPFLYVGVSAATLGLGAAGIFGDPAEQQAAAAALLLLAGGYAPTTPFTLLLMVLGVTLATRSLIAQSTRIALRESTQDLEELSRELDAV